MKVSRFIIFAVLAGYLVWVVYPMAWVAYSSLKTDEAIFREAFALPPLDALQTDNYTRAWNEARFGDYFLNSILVTLSSVTLIVLLGAMSAYALSRFYHPLGRGVFWLFLAGLMIPVQLSIVPLFFELRALGLLNSRLGLVLVTRQTGCRLRSSSSPDFSSRCRGRFTRRRWWTGVRRRRRFGACCCRWRSPGW